MSEETEPGFLWRVTRDEEGAVNIAFGPKLSAMPFDDDAKLTIVGKALISLGTQLMTSTTHDDDEDDDYGWDDDDE